jgi:hypothetical protein
MSTRPTINAPCADCAESYATCQGWLAQAIACADYRRLPDVGIDGKIGQRIPASRMGGRTEPRVEAQQDKPQGTHRNGGICPHQKKKPS